jgi:hypothetical protein
VAQRGTARAGGEVPTRLTDSLGIVLPTREGDADVILRRFEEHTGIKPILDSGEE